MKPASGKIDRFCFASNAFIPDITAFCAVILPQNGLPSPDNIYET
jgi:hypothetical protein